ncbi:MAG: DNA mismatch repair protein MutS [bacterium]|nr:DNA mismatch repair protein MutS [bacterium]MDD5757096.1 DNA mismatch repair protein MutS [bacterium]
MTTTKLTPLMEQYQRIKTQYPQALLFFRLGDFYELFGDDAKLASKLLQITLTARHQVPMCGVPYHSVTGYIAKLIKAGYKVAVCEQTEDPSTAKGLVKREIVRIITPGTILEDNLLERTHNNFLSAIAADPETKTYSLATADISTGEFMATQFKGETSLEQLATEIARLSPAEILLPESAKTNSSLMRISQDYQKLLNYREDWAFNYQNNYVKLITHFNVGTMKGFGLENLVTVIQAAGAVIDYLEETQKQSLAHLKRITYYNVEDHMILDESTLRHLEIMSSQQENSSQNTLLAVLDQTHTPMGSRLLKRWLTQPLIKAVQINKRLLAVEELYNTGINRRNIRELLKEMADLERLISRITCGTANPRDLVGLKNSLYLLPKVKEYALNLRSELLVETIDQIKPLPEIADLIEKSIIEEPPVSVKEGGLIKRGYQAELDKLHTAKYSSKEFLANLEIKEKERTGIHSLKVRFNSVFGYYIEVTKAHLDAVPPDYVRKQTLVNAERFITPELKEHEILILRAEEEINKLEYEVFNQVRQEIAKETSSIQRTATSLAQLDVLISFAEIASSNDYYKPVVDESGGLSLKDCRHPVVETMLSVADKFVPNDVSLDTEENLIHIITGPNMAGKSTYIRQAALCILMAQIGSFVPAKEAHIGIVDRIFTRIGSGDNIARGESTFMVEMMETANILNNATKRSLLILDEIGRGTSTFDGISIAWAVVEFLQERGFRTLFATHYFELTELSQTLSRVKNYNVLVREWQDKIVFLRKVAPGVADKSYGIHVAKLAGLPLSIIERSKQILDDLETNSYREDGVPKLAPHKLKKSQMMLFKEKES